MRGSTYIDFELALKAGLDLIKSKKKANFGLLIICGINLGLRIDDLLKLTFEDLRSERLIIKEGKTKKLRSLLINEHIHSVIGTYFLYSRGFAFTSQKGSVYSNQHVNRLLKLYFEGKVSSHSLRKSFGRRVWDNDNQSERSLLYLSELYNHSSISTTRLYLGIRQEELDEIYLSL